MKTKQVLIVGCGGIGSWLCESIYNYKCNYQFNNIEFTIIDDDTVDTKNLGYQNFKTGDLMEPKAQILGDRYLFKYLIERVETLSIINKFDCVISAVDNSKFRSLLFKSKDPYWIDLRSEGRTITFYTKHKDNTTDKMLNTLPKDISDNGSSCQLNFELENNIIQNGNRIIAAIGTQLILNWYRGEFNPPTLSFRF